MTVFRLVALTVLGWITVAIAFVGGLAWMATSVESVALGVWTAQLVAALQIPGLLAPIVPALCALGAGIAAARMDSRGERVALEGAGLGPWRTGLGALVAGLVVGAVAYGAQAEVVHRAEAALDGVAPQARSGWVWLDDRAVRLSDGLAVYVDDGVITHVAPEPLPDAATLARALVVQRPRTASRAALAGSDLAPVRLERHARLARVLSSGLLAWLAWLPLARRPSHHVGMALGLAAIWQAAEMAHQAAASQGHISPLVGAWMPVAALTALLGALRVVGYFTTRK